MTPFLVLRALIINATVMTNDFDDDVDCAMVLMRVSLFTRRRPNGEKRRVELFSFQPVVVYVVSSLLETKRTWWSFFRLPDTTKRKELDDLKGGTL